jgi:hypothetical protein
MKLVLRKTLQAAILSTGLIGAAAFATTKPLLTCSSADFNDANVSFVNCDGFLDNNLINMASTLAASNALATIGLTSNGAAISLATPTAQGSETLHFTDLLSGTVYIGIHIGGGRDYREGTAFYEITLANATHDITTTLPGLSNGGLYGAAPVPEPATYGMLMAGLGLLGVVARRRQKK